MSSYNALIKDYGNGRKKIILYDKLYGDIDDYILEKRKEKREKNKTNNTKEVERDYFIEASNTAKNKIYDLAFANRDTWQYFVTLTFNPNKVDRSNYSVCKQKLQMFLKNLRVRYCPNLTFIFIPELHKDGINWHFHGLMGNVSEDIFTIATKDGSPLIFNGHLVYNFNKWNYGFSECSKIKDVDKVCNYVTKYMTKSLMYHIEGENRYIRSRNLIMPKIKKLIIQNETYLKKFELYSDEYIGNVESYLMEEDLYNNDDVIFSKEKNFEYNGVLSKIKYIEIQENKK